MKLKDGTAVLFYFTLRCRRQRSLQYFTSSQQRDHFFRHEKGRLQDMQFFSGRNSFLCAIHLRVDATGTVSGFA
jgi:hypothetical protein